MRYPDLRRFGHSWIGEFSEEATRIASSKNKLTYLHCKSLTWLTLDEFFNPILYNVLVVLKLHGVNKTDYIKSKTWDVSTLLCSPMVATIERFHCITLSSKIFWLWGLCLAMLCNTLWFFSLQDLLWGTQVLVQQPRFDILTGRNLPFPRMELSKLPSWEEHRETHHIKMLLLVGNSVPVMLSALCLNQWRACYPGF